MKLLFLFTNHKMVFLGSQLLNIQSLLFAIDSKILISQVYHLIRFHFTATNKSKRSNYLPLNLGQFVTLFMKGRNRSDV